MERRKRSFPITFEVTKPSRDNPGGMQMYYAHEWETLEESRRRAREGEDAQPPDASSEPSSQPADTAAAAPEPGPCEELSSPAVHPAKPTECVSKGSIQPATAPKGPDVPPDFSHHARRCAACSTPNRDAIEGDFIRWRSPRIIADEYKLADRNSIYRHAHATGLFRRRRREFARVLENLLECVDHVPLESADIIVSAARVYARLDDEGRWFEPPRTHVVLTGHAPAPRAQSGDAADVIDLDAHQEAKKNLIATQPETENAPTS